MSILSDSVSFRRVLMVAGGHFVHDVYSSFLAPFLPLIIARSSISMTLAGLLTVFFRSSSLANPFLGILADRRDLRVYFAAAPAVTAMIMSSLGLSTSYPLICLMLLVAGVSASLYHVLGPVFVARFSGYRVGRGMSVWMVAGELGRSVGPVVAAGAVGLFGFEGMWGIMVFGMVASILLYQQIRTVPVVRHDHGPRPSVMATWRELRFVMLPMSGLLASRAFLTGTLAGFLPTYMVMDKGYTVVMGGMALALFELVGTAGSLLGGSLSDIIGRKKVLYAGMVLGPAWLLVLVRAHGWAITPCLVGIGLFVFACSPVLLATVQDHAGKNRGAANGLYMGLNFGITSLILLLVGWGVDRFGFDATLSGCAVLSWVSLPCIWALPEKGKTDAGDGAEA
ncbi:MFS transporter [Desulfoplanes formicivorans]|uniref:Permease n=1 Tax=Desulfoplanes formicivorans TaxID=1592317 RepID=A0A194AGI8_9BACT|nr:MFS transporter [Desulfoplanes formicivorans]GAU08325.1 permease [Desulfoplanes formicivorans]